MDAKELLEIAIREAADEAGIKIGFFSHSPNKLYVYNFEIEAAIAQITWKDTEIRIISPCSETTYDVLYTKSIPAIQRLIGPLLVEEYHLYG